MTIIIIIIRRRTQKNKFSHVESMKAVKCSVYSAAAGLLLRGIFGVPARECPLSFWWRFTADHRTELHWQDAHDNRSFCLIAISISFWLIKQPYFLYFPPFLESWGKAIVQYLAYRLKELFNDSLVKTGSRFVPKLINVMNESGSVNYRWLTYIAVTRHHLYWPNYVTHRKSHW